MSSPATPPLALLVGMLMLLQPSAWAQISPNCERNGRRDHCAVTPMAGIADQQSKEIITFADHTVYEVMRNETSCKTISERIRTCHAKITVRPGQSVAAFYRGTYYEGGYKNEYVGRGIHITYFVLD